MSAIVVKQISRPINKGIKCWAVAKAEHTESGYSITRYSNGKTAFFNERLCGPGSYAMLTRQNGKIYDALKAAVFA